MTADHDIIIVGAGSAGSAIASRASEDPNRDVLLLEAGPDYADPADTPFDLINSHNNSYRDHDWGLSHSPTEGRTMPLPRGKVTGGSSAVNTTIALRGIPEDFDEWNNHGNSEWAWEKVLPAFKRLERDLDFPDANYHGDAGPISIRRYPASELVEQQQAFLEAARSLGYPYCDDANAPDSTGAGPHPMNKLGRMRVSCAMGYLAPARARPNLTIESNSFVRRLIVEGDRCTSVEVERDNGVIERVRARSVVLSAGAIMSPAILKRSGVGPRRELEKFGIDVIRDTGGVGGNLCDHPALAISCVAKDPSIIDADQPLIQTILRYTAAGSDKRNDLQIELLSFGANRQGHASFAIAAVLEYTFGRGDLRLASADPHIAPVIENRFCEDDRDARRLASCFRDALAFAKAPPLASMIERVAFPSLDRGIDDETIVKLCKERSGSGYHPCGTARMGPKEDPDSVVNEYGQLHTLANVVVADASIMPSVPRANTNLTSIMIGEKIGEWLRTSQTIYGF